MKIIIGLTGPTGAGKSSLFPLAVSLGFKVIDCDKTARKATEKGTDGLLAVTKVFGKDILNPDGTLNRKVLAQKAFKTQENTELLNKTLLPYIVNLVLREADGDRVILDAPTLFESGIDSHCVKTVAVLADKDKRLKRIFERDNISKEDALLRINAGKPDDFYKKNADYIIYNNEELKEFTSRFKEILMDILKER